MGISLDMFDMGIEWAPRAEESVEDNPTGVSIELSVLPLDSLCLDLPKDFIRSDCSCFTMGRLTLDFFGKADSFFPTEGFDREEVEDFAGSTVVDTLHAGLITVSGTTKTGTTGLLPLLRF